MHGKTIRRKHHHADRHQILLHVEGQFLHQAGLRGDGADVGDQQCMAVAGLLGDEIGTDVARCTRLVFDYDRLTDCRRQLWPDQPRQDVRRTARSVGHDHVHLFSEILARGRHRTATERRNARSEPG